jgi:hypothetical protein
MARISIIRLRQTFGVIGALAAAPFLVWVPLGLLEAIPSMVDVFGIPGLRIPASIVIGGLLAAAIGFHEYSDA